MIWYVFGAIGAVLLALVGLLARKVGRAESVARQLRSELTEFEDRVARDRVATSDRLSEQQVQLRKLREGGDDLRGRAGNIRQSADARHDTQVRVNNELRDSVQDAKDRAARARQMSLTVSGELVHGSRRFVRDDERTTLVGLAGALGLDWVTERHVRYLEHTVPAIEGRLRGRLAAPTAAMALRAMVVMAAPDPTRVLEIGTLYGMSAAFLHETVRPGKTGFHQTVIDPFFGYYGQDDPDLFTPIPVIEDVFRENMARVGATDDDVEVIVGLAEATDIRAQLADRTFEVLVIDGDHSLEGVTRDFENYADHVVPGGFVIIDDYRGPSWPDVTAFVDDQVFTDDRFEVVTGELRTAVVRRRNP